DPELADRVGLLEHLAGNSAGMQHQCGSEAADAAADDDDLHTLLPRHRPLWLSIHSVAGGSASATRNPFPATWSGRGARVSINYPASIAGNRSTTMRIA